eukprot:scaffold32031_cov22-Tisochrysis_lutea.AAC.1
MDEAEEGGGCVEEIQCSGMWRARPTATQLDREEIESTYCLIYRRERECKKPTRGGGYERDDSRATRSPEFQRERGVLI